METIDENTKLLEEIVHLCEEKEIKVIFTLLPQYYLMEKFYVALNDMWRPMFSKRINELLTKHDVEFYNFTNEERISKNERFFCDSTHLNTVGGYAMTDILCKTVYRI